jgi:hypothetical protein
VSRAAHAPKSHLGAVQRERDPLSVGDFQDRAEERHRASAQAAADRYLRKQRKEQRAREWEEAAEERQNAYRRDMEERRQRTERQLAVRAAELGLPSLTLTEYVISLTNAAYVVRERANAE